MFWNVSGSRNISFGGFGTPQLFKHNILGARNHQKHYFSELLSRQSRDTARPIDLECHKQIINTPVKSAGAHLISIDLESHKQINKTPVQSAGTHFISMASPDPGHHCQGRSPKSLFLKVSGCEIIVFEHLGIRNHCFDGFGM